MALAIEPLHSEVRGSGKYVYDIRDNRGSLCLLFTVAVLRAICCIVVGTGASPLLYAYLFCTLWLRKRSIVLEVVGIGCRPDTRSPSEMRRERPTVKRSAYF